MKTILFLCGHNAGRSQMAEAYFNHKNKNPHVCAISAGTHPGKNINPECKKILKEEGITILEAFPKMITKKMLTDADEIFTMGCGVDCSRISREITADLALDDPNGKSTEEIWAIFEELKKKVSPVIEKHRM